MTDADHRLLARRRLTDAGWEVRVASSAEEALDALDGVDLMLCDYRLPGMSGIDVLHEISRRPGGPSVVMVTGMGSEGVAVAAMRAGAIDYITKDATYLEGLPSAVERAWRHHDLKRRAKELERLAMLVTATGERDRTLAANARVEVVDRGPGILPDELDHVFEPFWRGSTVLHGNLRGTGLGLALVREYARLLGGEVGVASSPGGGSRFWFTVPLSDAHPNATIGGAEGPAPAPR